ncbi:hypothetical protein [Roseovarius sp.]|uniref:hypothetical protein n=1 Tax=Roseovarius sp. TaxID=1486281 RepID=UPI003BAC9DC6
MSGTRFRPPRSIWDTEIPGMQHAGERRPDLWRTLHDVLSELDGEAASRVERAMRDPLASEGLVAAMEVWEIREGDPVTIFRERYDDADNRTAKTRLKDIRKRLDRLPEEYMTAMIPRLIAAALEVEDRPGAPIGDKVGRAARDAARALAKLRELVVQAEEAAPPARGGQLMAETQARLRLFDSVRRTLECEDDAVFKVIKQALWETITGAEELPDYKRNDR